MNMQGTDDLKEKVQGASPAELVIILYDGALRFLDNAKQAWEDSNDDLAQENLLKTKNIILELQKSLKADDSEAILSLATVYEKVLGYIAQAQDTKKSEYVDLVVKILDELKETWVKINQTD